MARIQIPTFHHGLFAQKSLQETNFAPFQRYVSSEQELKKRRRRVIENVKEGKK